MRYLLILIITIGGNVLHSQTIGEVKANPSVYIWGIGSGTTLKSADKEALSFLISQISTSVESSFELLQNEYSDESNNSEFTEAVKSVISTYSSATLKNTERIIISNEPEAKVFRFIKRSEISKVFYQREQKILSFVDNAQKYIEDRKIADGLRYYYWALTLLKSHPNGNEIEYIDNNSKNHLLASWLPVRINDVFSKVDIRVYDVIIDNDLTSYILKIKYDDKFINNFDYTYWNGIDWSNTISANNGLGVVDFYGDESRRDVLRLKCEYIFEGEARVDRELEDVLGEFEPISFKNSYKSIYIKERDNSKVISDIGELKLIGEISSELYHKNIDKIITSTKRKDYASVQPLFTNQGYIIYKKLVAYGNAKILDVPDLRFLSFGDKVICRSIPMSFKFRTNNKKFVENVIFHFNDEGKIDNLTFGLSKKSLNDILGNESWSETDRLTIVNFIENYKTAYALKRLSYIEKIYSDDALIITGSVINLKPTEVNPYKNKIVSYNRQSKQAYIKNLKYLFRKKEYVNIKFEDTIIRKAGKGDDIYGIQIKQRYFSSNYGDEGYLFLMVDLNDIKQPIIHVRTWQPELNFEDHFYGLSDFN